MTFERDRVLMLRTSLAEERAYADRLAQIAGEILDLDPTDYTSVVGYEAAVRTLAYAIVNRHTERKDA